MTTEIAPNDADSGTIEVLPPAQEVNMAAIGTLREHVSAMRDAVYFAEGMCYTEMVPQRFRGKPKDAAAAILFGAEVGLSPVASLRSVIVIHGQPGFEARTMKAILKAHGYGFRTIEKTPTRAEIWAWEPDSPKVYDDDPKSPHCGKRIHPDDVAAWTFDDAVQAGFVPTKDDKGKWVLNSNGKLKGNMKYIETPKVMLDAKVTAEVCRSIAPHLLLGLPYASEELESESWETSAPIAVAQRAAAPVTADEILGQAAPAEKPKRKPRAKAEPKPEPQDAEVVDEPAADNETDNAPAKTASGNRPEPDTSQVNTPEEPSKEADSPADAPTDDLRKSARASLTGAIFSMLGEVGLADDKNREDRLVVIEAIAGRPVASSKELTDDELQNLRNSLYSRQQAGTLEADVNDWLNWHAVKKAEAAEAAAESTTTEGN